MFCELVPRQGAAANDHTRAVQSFRNLRRGAFLLDVFSQPGEDVAGVAIARRENMFLHLGDQWIAFQLLSYSCASRAGLTASDHPKIRSPKRALGKDGFEFGFGLEALRPVTVEVTGPEGEMIGGRPSHRGGGDSHDNRYPKYRTGMPNWEASRFSNDHRKRPPLARRAF